jgi:hypothetical protein
MRLNLISMFRPLTEDMFVGPNLKFNGFSYKVRTAGMPNIADSLTGKKRRQRIGEVDKKNANWLCSSSSSLKCNGSAITAGKSVAERTQHTCK